MDFTYFIGTDTSKNELDIAVYKSKELLYHEEISNESKVIRKFLKELNKLEGFSLQEAVFCMEFTGIYNNHFVYELVKKKANVWLEPASRIKKSMGMVRGKNDKLDAIRIGKYAYKNSDEARLWKPRRNVISKLHHFTTLRRRLLTVKNILSTPLKEMDLYVEKSVSSKCKNFSKRTLNSIEADIKKVEKEIDQLIAEDPGVARQVELITSINGVGKQTAIGAIVTTNEFKDIRDPKKICLLLWYSTVPQ